MISKLTLTNFRSYADRTLVLNPGTTVIVGPNATGKTNLLEAVFVLATTKSFRAKDPELVRNGEDFYRITAILPEGEIALGFQQTDQGREKRAQLDGVRRSLVQHLGSIRVVLFEPNDLQLVLGAPDRRRRYLDFILTQTDKTYLQTLHQYQRVLKQRNTLLDNWNGQTDELFAWNIKLTDLATDIDRARRLLIDHINTLVEQLYAQISGASAELRLIYQGAADDDYPTAFMALLEERQPRDIGAGFTTVGPHRDDFDIIFKDQPIATVASRGEIRSVVLALKLAELSYIEQQTDSSPLLLLDDVFSELDERRRTHLIAALRDRQAIITTTDADTASQLDDAHVISTSDLQRA